MPRANSSGGPSTSPSHDPFWLAYAVLAPLFLAPLVVTPFLPSFDLPHHLAVVDALLKAQASDSPYAADFVVGLGAAPFATHFVVLAALGRFVSLTVAARLLVAAVVLTLPLAAARLLSACRRPRLSAVLAFPLACGMPLHFGFIGFVAALPLLVWMLALAADEEAWRARPAHHGLALSLVAMATYFTHLEAWAVGVAAALGAIAAGRLPSRSRVVALAAVVPSVVIAAVYIFHEQAVNGSARTPSLLDVLVRARLAELREHTAAADIVGRLGALPIHLLRGFTDHSDMVASRLLWGLVVACVALRGWYWLRRSQRRFTVAPAGALAVAVLLAYLGLPHHAPPAFSLYPRFAGVLLIALLPALPDWRTRSTRTVRAAAACMCAGLALHAVNLTWHYRMYADELADFRAVLDAAPAGRRAGGLVFDAESSVMDVGGLFTGVPAYYVTERPASASWTWLYYCTWPQMPCHMRRRDTPAPVPFFSTPNQFDPVRALKDIDLWFVRGGPADVELFGPAASRNRLLAARGHWRVFERVSAGIPRPTYFVPSPEGP